MQNVQSDLEIDGQTNVVAGSQDVRNVDSTFPVMRGDRDGGSKVEQ